VPKIKRRWTPHTIQRRILNDETRFRVVAAGRRTGKTTFARNDCFEYAWQNPGAYVWYVAPTDADARELAFEPLVNEIIPEAALDGEPKRSSPREIYLTNGSRIQIRSARTSSRGRGLDRAYLDEACEYGGDYWKEVVRPSLSDKEGGALIMSTPQGRNYFYDLFQRGGDDSYPEWSSHHATTYDNPHVPDSEVEKARRTLPERVFTQEYLAEFHTDEGAVFPDPDDATKPYALDDVSGNAPYATGVDLARSSNYLVAATLDKSGMLVDLMRTRGGSWARAQRRLSTYLAEYPGVAYMDASRDNKVIEDLSRELREVQVEPVRFTASSKQNMIENLAARLETADIILPRDGEHVDTLRTELRAYEYETTDAGNVRYGPPEGYNDDCVDALALGAKETKQAKSTW
jgi:phage FluMu gp28-like protein